MSKEVWLASILSVLVVSFISLIGVLTLSLREKLLQRLLLLLISFSIGALLGDAFLHLLPEIVEVQEGFTLTIALFTLLGIMVFFVIEKFIRWHHSHLHHHHHANEEGPHQIKPYAFMNLFGDGVHNFIDGMIVAGSYIISIPLGIATTVAVVLHEIPQEIGDFAVLISAGMAKAKAIFFNFLSALTAIAGAIVTLLIGTRIENFSLFLIPFTAGGFIYIAASDLIPELHHEKSFAKALVQVLGILLGIGVMALLLVLE